MNLGAIGGIIGGVAGLAGGLLGGSSARRRRNELRRIAQTPGVDVGDVYGESFDAMEGSMPQAERVTGDMNTFNQAEMNRLLEMAIPGYTQMQKDRTGVASSMVRGELPPDVEKQVIRSATARSVGGGYGGSGMGRSLESRDLGLTSLDLMDRGQRFAGGIIGSTPRAGILSTTDLLNLDPSEVLGLRSRERTHKMDMLTGAANAPGRTDVLAKGLTSLGGGLLGATSFGGLGG